MPGARSLPDEPTVLPVQYIPRRPLAPTQRLALALLEDCFLAINQARKFLQSGRWRRVLADDIAWVSGSPAPLSFEMVCQSLNLSPDAVRAAYCARAENGHAGTFQQALAANPSKQKGGFSGCRRPDRDG